MPDSDDFDVFYATSARRVLHHVYAVCGDLAEAQDLTQEVAGPSQDRLTVLAALRRLLRGRHAGPGATAARIDAAVFHRRGACRAPGTADRDGPHRRG
jgi:hypothetical protein